MTIAPDSQTITCITCGVEFTRDAHENYCPDCRRDEPPLFESPDPTDDEMHHPDVETN